ncbi:hypothetical protein SpiGrapes_3270 [Sphaerochaeta pleomorpha str. Grapes]|uniref:Uncharacterized protein n=1 Tax=Sphaerochaeta pleomorpha (strain ATCC BAA-1885 / DSM 22778 / Grapes) TaxID=158190 RepID=G8QR79_SPHPG|nr:hypothetical protein [Sphaerochaeta pleomorpha]AEV31014.1 hypothetical protein SpiGrapes_3270 [Sphaerochaeta pleomorpha str. Grapes]
MNSLKSTGPSWTTRIIGTANESERIERIIGRYAHFVYTKKNILDTFLLEEIYEIGETLLSLSLSKQDFPQPYSFGELYLAEHSLLQKKFNACEYPLQCRVLDVAEEYKKAKGLYALIAIDWESGISQLLSISSDTGRLKMEAEGFLSDPLLENMVDRHLEGTLASLLDRSREIVKTEKNTENTGLYAVRCSDAFFVNNLFSFFLDAKFTILSGKNLDEFGHHLPEFITIA